MCAIPPRHRGRPVGVSGPTAGIAPARPHTPPTPRRRTFLSKPGEVTAAVYEALKVGYRHIDCAAVYGNEKEVGAGLAQAFTEGICSREEVWITSKLWVNRSDPSEVEAALDGTLADLGVAALDLYLIHWPHFIQAGKSPAPDTMIGYDATAYAATWAAMEAVAAKGKTAAIGVSNMSVSKLKALLASRVGVTVPAVNQVESHPCLPQTALLEYCTGAGIALTAYSPLGAPGLVASRGVDAAPAPLASPVVATIAKKHGVGAGQVLIRWSIQRGVIVIPKSVTPSRIASNFGVWEWALDGEDLAALAGLEDGKRAIDGSLFLKEGQALEDIWA